MKTTELRNLNEAIRGVHIGQKKTEVVEQKTISDNVSDYIASMISEAENKLNTKFTDQEIQESTMFILEQIGNAMLIETVQNQVGFKLNEEEIGYVLNTLNEHA